MGQGASVHPSRSTFLPSWFSSPLTVKLISKPLVIGLREKRMLLLNEWKYHISKDVLKIGAELALGADIKKSIIGKSVDDSACFDLFHQRFKDTVLENISGIPSDFKYFGSHNNKLNLCTILKHNPLYGMHLKSVRDSNGILAFEIKSYNPGSSSWYSQLIESASFTFKNRIFINAKFTANMELMEITPFDFAGRKLSGISEQDCCGYLINSLRMAAQLIHGIQHIYHGVMISAIYNACIINEKSDLLASWAKQYCPQIMLKHVEVEAVLFNRSGVLTANAKQQPVIMAVLTKMMRSWGSYLTANEFNTDFVLRSLLRRATLEELKELGFFTEYFKHCDMISPYSSELYNEFKRYNMDHIDCVDDDLESYLGMVDVACKWKISTLQQWIESMSVTGIMHGFVNGGTRLQLTVGVFGKDYLYGASKKKFTKKDYDVIVLLAGTLAGIQPGMAVFSAAVNETLTNESVKAVIKKYEDISNGYKQDYYDKIRKLPNYADIGFIINDGIIDNVDGRQLTITTYV